MSPDAWSETQWADVYLNWIHKPLPSFSVITKKGFTTLFVQKKRILAAPSLCGPQPWASRGANSLSSEAAISLKAAVWLARLPISFSFLLFGKNLQKFLTLTITLLGACFFFTMPWSLWDLSSLTRDWTWGPLQWKGSVLTTGPPGNSWLLLL